jgi:hypothetical protein
MSESPSPENPFAGTRWGFPRGRAYQPKRRRTAVTEHVLLVGREEGLARRYRQHGADAVSVLCRTEHVSRIKAAADCARVLALPAQAGLGEWVGIARAPARRPPGDPDRPVR